MTRQKAAAPVRRLQPSLLPQTVHGPILPGETRAIYETPAASDPSFWAGVSEGELLRALVLYHQWTRLDHSTLRRYRRHGAQLSIIEGGAHAA